MYRIVEIYDNLNNVISEYRYEKYKSFLWWHSWSDDYIIDFIDNYTYYSFKTLEEAKKMLPYYSGQKEWFTKTVICS